MQRHEVSVKKTVMKKKHNHNGKKKQQNQNQNRELESKRRRIVREPFQKKKKGKRVFTKEEKKKDFTAFCVSVSSSNEIFLLPKKIRRFWVYS